jgi:hypothetical protein
LARGSPRSPNTKARPETAGKRLVPVDRGRLAPLLKRQGRPAAQIAKAAGITRSKLGKLLTGENGGCPLAVRKALAAELGASDAYLSGDPLARPPGIREAELEVLYRRSPAIEQIIYRLGPLFETPNHATSLPPPIELEVTATYRAIRSAIELTDDQALTLLYYLPDFMDIGFWRRFLHEDLEPGRASEADREHFAAAVGTVIRLLLAPYGRGKAATAETHAVRIFGYLAETVSESLRVAQSTQTRLRTRAAAGAANSAMSRAEVLWFLLEELQKQRLALLFPVGDGKKPNT